MAKDPAVLWYWNDWNGGTVTLNRHLKGCYMDLLHAQFNNGNLSLSEIKTVLASDFGLAWPTLQKKFKQDENGNFYNERLVTESIKRKSYTKSRRDNLNGDSHMENENEIENLKLIFKGEVEKFRDEFGEQTVIDFIDYWTELNKSRKKMRFQMQKVFEISKRLATWRKNELKFSKSNSTNGTKESFASAASRY